MPLSFNRIANFFNGTALGQLAQNFTDIEDEFPKILYRDGSNTMRGNLDMDGRRIINHGEPKDDNDLATLSQVRDYTSSITQGPPGTSDNTYTSYAALLASDKSRRSARLVGDPVEPDGIFSAVAGQWVRQKPSSIATAQFGTGAITEDLATTVNRAVWAEQYGLNPNNTPAQNSTALLNAIKALRSNPTTLSTDGLGSGPLTAYSSGLLLIGPGVFKIAPDTIQLTQDLGLIIRGSGSRRSNNSILARTTLLISGTSSGFGIQTKANGARGLTLEDFDLNYENTNFTGDCLDVYSTPGVTINRMHIGTHGTGAATRYQSARSCIRSTYDEFLHVNDTVFDGAVDFWWSDDLRGTVGPFGGSQTQFFNCTFYDCTGSMMRHDGNRTRAGLGIIGCAYNPIAVNCQRSIKIDNCTAFVMLTSGFNGSVANHATEEWVRITNTTGVIQGNWWGDFARAAYLTGFLTVEANEVFCPEGFVFAAGMLKGGSNRFRKATSNAWLFSPFDNIDVSLSGDSFSNLVGSSYYSPDTSGLVKGLIDYSLSRDLSSSKWENRSPSLRIEDQSGDTIQTDSDGTVTRFLSGKTIRCLKNAGTQVQTLPKASPGLKFVFEKVGAASLQLKTMTGDNFLAGETFAPTVLTIPASSVGGVLTVVSRGTSEWLVRERSAGITAS